MHPHGHRCDRFTSLPLTLPLSPRPSLSSLPPRLPYADGLMRPHGLGRSDASSFFLGCCLLEKRRKKCLVFGFQSPSSPNSPIYAGEAARRRRLFLPSSLSHPSKLYSSLGWLNSKVPKPFFPFTPRLIDVDGS
jgi:hypothetical protein